MMSSSSLAANRMLLLGSKRLSTSRFPQTGRCFATKVRTTFDLPDPTLTYNNNNKKTAFPLTKIVATIGPTSEQLEPLRKVVRAGMTVMRLNFSHATKEEVALRTSNLLQCQKVLTNHSGSVLKQQQNVLATLLDTRGPEIRSGKLKNDHSGHETISLVKGDSITLQTSDHYAKEGSTVDNLYINYAGLAECLSPGMKVLLDDGAVILTVTSVHPATGSVDCSIDNSGDLRSRAGVNLPLAETNLPAMSEKDKADIKYGLEIDVDYVAASFVQNAEGVREIREYMQQCAKEMGLDASYPLPKIISKIESASALKHFDAILEESDGIMVARGDLGVEIPIQQVTNAQKEMVAACNAAGKPVIVATQMLESMAKNPRPTRAEVADVTNAVYDGADATMLSGETAKGKYPDEAVKMMQEIILAAETYATSNALGSQYVQHTSLFEGPDDDLHSALAKGCVAASLEQEDVSAILVVTEAGELPPLVAAHRPNVPIIVFCPTDKMARQLILHRGIYPVVMGSMTGIAEGKRAHTALKEAKQLGYIQGGDAVIVVQVTREFEMSANLQLTIVPEELE